MHGVSSLKIKVYVLYDTIYNIKDKRYETVRKSILKSKRVA